MQVRVGVVSTPGVDPGVGRRLNGDTYVVCGEGRTAWLDGGEERSGVGLGEGWLLAVIGGDGADDAALRAARAMAQVVCKVYQPGRPRDASEVLMRFLQDAHTRMYWAAQDQRPARPAASVAVTWALGNQLHWVRVGSVRPWVFGDGQLRPLGRPWPAGEEQRMIGGSRGLGDDTAIHLRRGLNVGTLQLQDGDRVLLASRGFWSAVDEASISQILRFVSDPQAAAVACLERARARGSREPVAVLVADASQVDPEDEQTLEVPAPSERRGGG